jgi:acetyl-CoA carboxylase carboxyl transferase subunit alpha
MNQTTSQNKTAIERVRVARHPSRPYPLDLFEMLFEDFIELHGDRRYADDPAMVCGMAKLGEHEVIVIGHQKGRDTKQRHQRNFGMPKPEGYRKALRIMELAEKFDRPIITFIDTPGAYPGIDAEERGQAEAIAYNLREMANLRCPIIIVVIGEGGSGGALAIGVGDRVLMMENSVYSVISPEGCAAILWKDAAKADSAAEQLKLTAPDLLSLGLIDSIIPEPLEWKIEDLKDQENSFHKVFKETIIKEIDDLSKLNPAQLMEARWQKLRRLGQWQII